MGVVSWGGPDCAEAGHPAVWMDVSKASAWIRRVVRDGAVTTQRTTRG